MNVLSLFDGMSCGRIALERAGIPLTQYLASEIDTHAIKVSKANYPDIIHIGDVTKINGNYISPKVDLLIGGSPCQGFSFAGKQLNFDDPRSKLFFEFVRIKQQTNPTYFLLENVMMKKESQDIISSYLGVKPIMINSALVSAQNRKRLYWTNIPNVEQPKDLGLIIKDIAEDGLDYSGGAIRGRYLPNGKTHQVLELNGTKKVNALTTVQKDSLCVMVGKIDSKFEARGRVYSIDGKSPTLTAVCGGHQEVKVAIDDLYYRKLTPIEYERLQNVPDNYTNHVCKTQRYRMCGNGWNVNTITHIFKNIPIPN